MKIGWLLGVNRRKQEKGKGAIEAFKDRKVVGKGKMGCPLQVPERLLLVFIILHFMNSQVNSTSTYFLQQAILPSS